jgi:methionyl-tRNA synthetase
VKTFKRTLITAALPYVNGPLHLGHLAGAYLPADIYARYCRLAGKETLFICGSDEHGVAITISADKEGVSPRVIIDRYHALAIDSFTKLGLSFDHYSRTSQPIHHKTAQEYFLDLYAKGLLIPKTQAQLFCPKDQMFLPDRYVEGTCPNCGSTQARGDQCESCGKDLDPSQLINPRCKMCGTTPESRDATHLFFTFGAFQKFLEQYVESHAPEWKENVLQQTRSWLKAGLEDRAVTRDLTWGVEVPLESMKGKRIYVWFEAVLGYISSTKEWAEGAGADWRLWWQDEGTRYIAFIGKDNIVFHTLQFPAMLHAHGGYILPDNVPANEFLNLEGQKFSKSRGWSIDLPDYVAEFPADPLRYAMAMSFPETRDADFTWRDFQARNNNELADILGNFVNRTVTFAHKNFAGALPELVPAAPAKRDEVLSLLRHDLELLVNAEGTVDAVEQTTAYTRTQAKYALYFTAQDFWMLWRLFVAPRRIADCYEHFRFRDGTAAMMDLARAANKYFNDSQPWKEFKTDPERCGVTVNLCLQVVASFSTLIEPVLPFSAKTLRTLVSLDLPAASWEASGMPMLCVGTPLGTPAILFVKYDDARIQTQIDKLGALGAPPTA